MGWRSRLLVVFVVFALAARLASIAAAEQVVYGYDEAGRLVSFQQGNTLVTYAYDPAGNLLARSVPEPDASLLGLVAFLAVALLRRRRRVVLAAALIVLPMSASASTVCKPAVGSCDHETIEDALDAAAIGETITVSFGIYAESNLNVGQVTLISEDPMSPEGTIIDATGSDLPVIGAAASATIEGFTIQGGNNMGAPGGGVRTAGGAVTLRHLIIRDNSTDFMGGGVGTNSGGSLTIENCEIRNNSAERFGGGVVGPGTVVIRDSTIEGNFVTGPVLNGGGGGVFAGQFTQLTIERTTLGDNFIVTSQVTNALGGGLWASSANVVLRDVSIVGNIVSGGTNSRGGGAYLTGSTVDVSGGLISNNSATQGGGAFLAFTGAPIFSGTLITANTALTEGGGVFCTSSTDLANSFGILSGNGPDQSFGCQPPPLPGGSVADMKEGAELLDPVHTFSGELFDSFVDLRLGGPMPLAFGRYYASGLQDAGIGGRVGRNWRHVLEWSLAARSSEISLVTNEGRVIEFADAGGGAWTLSAPIDIPYQLDESAGEFTLLDPTTRRRYVFDATGVLTDVLDENDNIHVLTYAGTGELASVSDGFGRSLTFTHNAQGRVETVSDGTRTLTFTYLGPDLASVIDVLGETTAYAYDSDGRMTTWTRPEGNQPFAQTYDGSGRVDSQTDSESNTNGLAYSGLDTTITDPLTNTRVHTHNAMGELTSATDEMGQSVAMTSDATGRRDGVTDRLGDPTGNGFDALSGQLSQVTHADGTTTDFTYVSRAVGAQTQRDLSLVTHRDATTQGFGVDGAGNVTSHTDQVGEVTTMTYDASGRILTTTNPESGLTTLTYNADGTLDTATDTLLETTSYAYDDLQRVTDITRPDASVKTFSYDAADRVTSIIDENNHTTSMTYGKNGNLLTITNAENETTTFSYDGNDRLLSVTQPTAESMLFAYEDNGLLESITDFNGNAITFAYDARRRLISTTDALTNQVSQTYDDEGVLATATDARGMTTTFLSDEMGRITGMTTPLTHLRQVGYDAMGRVTSTVDPMGQTTTLARDDRGDVTSAALPGGATTTAYVMDGLRNKTVLTDANDNDWLRTYDPGGRLTSNSDPLGNTRTISYDDRGRVDVITLPGGMGTETRGYDAVGNLTSRSFSDGTLLTYTYDAADRLVSAGGVTLGYDANGRMNESNGITMVRDAGGRITTMTLAPGIVVTYTYDDADRLIQLGDSLGGTTTYDYDADGRLTERNRTNGVVTTWTYDDDGQLASITDVAPASSAGGAGAGPGGAILSSIVITRDANGRVASTDSNVPFTGSANALANTAATYDAASRRSGATFDALSRTLSAGGYAYTYNLASQLTNTTGNGSGANHVSDDLGSLVTRPSGKEIRDLVRNYALPDAPAVIERSLGVDTRYNISNPEGEPQYWVDVGSGAHKELHWTEVGNMNMVTRPDGTVAGSYGFEPYGEPLGFTGNLDNPFGVWGQMGAMDMGGNTVSLGEALYNWAITRQLLAELLPEIDPEQQQPYEQFKNSNPVVSRNVLPSPETLRRLFEPEFVVPDPVQDLVDQLGPRREATAKWTRDCSGPTIVEDREQERLKERRQEIRDAIEEIELTIAAARLQRFEALKALVALGELDLGAGRIREFDRKIREFRERILELEKEIEREELSPLEDFAELVVVC